ncbi:MAG TPA: penicillin-binding protein [Clostridiales bacterium]|nr:penicillin-binding protein [Clostridiales bacterium]
MGKLIKTSRLFALSLLIAVLVGTYAVTLYKLQIIEGAAYYEESRNNIVTSAAVTAARGNIYDRYGRVLVSNRECYNIKLNADALFYGDLEDPNAAILDIVGIVRACGDTYIDELPVTLEPPFEYTAMTSIQETMLQAYLRDKDMDEGTTAVELMSYFRTRYGIDNNYSAEDMRTVAGIRYEINVRYAQNFATTQYIFVEDASIALISKLMEAYGDIVEIETSFVREYNTQYAAHLLGYIGLMNHTEYERYSKTGDYKMDAKVGKDGVELAFERYLHGKDGEAQITSTAGGTVTNTLYTEEPEPGNHLYLTIDLQLQEAAEKALEAGITRLQRARDTANLEAESIGALDKVAEDIQGGAIAVVDVTSGEPLVLASYPTYRLDTMIEDYSGLLEAENDPLFNRALMGAYAPGSTFKPCTAIACLTENIINTEETIKCQGIFTKYAYAGYTPTCWIYPDGLHGNENISTAVRDSCNYYFYTVGDLLGVDKLVEYAHRFGLGVPTGIELPETVGNMTNRENHEEITGESWTQGDALQAAIGQSDSLFTPLQLAEYCAAIANGGTRYSASILKSVRSYDYSEKILESGSDVLSTVSSPDYNYAAVQYGMYLVANDPAGSAYADLFGYPVDVAAKTGTAQLGKGKTYNAIFICYAPYDDPEIAIAIVLERGVAGSNLCSIARDVLDSYFSIKNASNTLENENKLLK